MNLEDSQSERDLLHLLRDEATVLGVQHGTRLLDKLQLQRSDFFSATHQILFGALSNVIRAGRVPDTPQLKRAAPELNGEVEKFCAPPAKTLSPEQSEGLADHIRDLARRRFLLASFERQTEALVRGDSVADVVARTQGDLNRLPNTGPTWTEPEDSCGEFEKQLHEIQDGTRKPCTPTGIAKLDDAIMGFQPTLNVVCARGGVGKSALAAAVLRNMAKRGESSLTFSLEDGHAGIRVRHYAIESGMTQRALRSRGWGSFDQERVAEAAAKIRAWPGKVLIDQSPSLTSGELLHRARTAILTRGVRLVLVDNVTSMHWDRGERSDLDIQDFLRRCRDLSEQTQVPCVVLAHVKASVAEGVVPDLSDCSESGGFAKLARVGIGLARKRGEDVLRCGIAKGTFVAKAGDVLELEFDGPFGMVRNS